MNMFLLILQTIIVSLVIIFLVHHLINYFKSILTVPKVKDFVVAPEIKYKNISDILSKPSSHQPPNTTTIVPTIDMESELMNFVSQLQPKLR